MEWIAPTGKDTATDTLERQLWDAADQFCANSGIMSQCPSIQMSIHEGTVPNAA